jgi:polysaccharide deacetylase 2 family uncharacterized protein YibQ
MSEKGLKSIVRLLVAGALIIALSAIFGCTQKELSSNTPLASKQDAADSGTEHTANPSVAIQNEPRAYQSMDSETAGDASDDVEGTAATEAQDAAQTAESAIESNPEQSIGLISGNASGPAKLAIIIDDFGYRSEATERIIALEQPITCAILPDARTTAQDGADAYDAGKLVILHMPMEALDASKSVGEGFIRVGMESDVVSSLLAKALDKVPMAAGVSNHMGSRASLDATVMREVLEEVRSRGLFYLDSRTSTDTLGPEIAAALGMEAYLNGLFIDSEDDVSYIKGKIWEAAGKAKADGQAVAIGHVKSSTATALAEVLPLLKNYGVELVFVNELVPVSQARP